MIETTGTGALPDDVREFLAEVCGRKTVEQVRADYENWRGLADLNEDRLSGLALIAAELLAKYAPGPT